MYEKSMVIYGLKIGTFVLGHRLKGELKAHLALFRKATWLGDQDYVHLPRLPDREYIVPIGSDHVR